MTDIGTTIERIRSADPVPSPDALPIGAMSSDALLARIDERSTNVTDLQTRTDDTATQPRRRNGLVITLAAAAALIVLIGLIAVATGGSGDAPITEPDTSTTLQTPTTTTTTQEQLRLDVAERFVDTFYSYDAAALGVVLAALPEPEEEAATVGYYQAFLAAADGTVLERTACSSAVAAVTCVVTMEDDLVRALDTPGLVFVDTWIFNFDGTAISDVRWSSDEPDLVTQAWQWIGENHRESRAPGAACEGFLAGGPSPAECAQLTAGLFAEFAVSADRQGEG